MQELFVTADDRTGSLEVGGIIANAQFPVPVGPAAQGDICAVVDIASRHVTPEVARQRVLDVHQIESRYRCHKMDAGLRGNWPHEIMALNELGYSVAVIPSFPDAGRRCKDGVVYIHDVPVLEGPFGQDPLTAPCSSRPDEVMEEAGCTGGDVVIWDANDNAELEQAISRCRAENKMLVGPTGAIGAYADTVFPNLASRQVPIENPVLIVCGSLNAHSRDQISRLSCPVYGLDDVIQVESLSILASPLRSGEVSNEEAESVAEALADKVSDIEVRTLFVIGGDTAGAIVGDETLDVLGTVAPGIPISRFRDGLLVTKGGGIGTPDILVNLLGGPE
ncbi:MAG TPA: hypothetical protein DCM54_03280 [Gammaproteobacteria bacterium]|nr:hypothetical protein [Gammaproteobacteria bacterium]